MSIQEPQNELTLASKRPRRSGHLRLIDGIIYDCKIAFGRWFLIRRPIGGPRSAIGIIDYLLMIVRSKVYLLSLAIAVPAIRLFYADGRTLL